MGMLFRPFICCSLSLRKGNAVVAIFSLLIYVGVLVGFTVAADSITQIYTVSQIGEKGILSFCLLGSTLAFLYLVGVFLDNIFLCAPWAAFSAFTAILDFIGLIYTSTYGLPLVNTNDSQKKIYTYFVWYFMFALHIYFLWVVLLYVRQLNDGIKGNYEEFPQGYSPASSRSFTDRGRSRQRRSGRSPVFKIRDSSE